MSEHQPIISVIIAVHNVADYLDKCLWSVTNQTLRDIEIIVVNDGSTDNSLEVAEKHAAQDSRIKIVSKKQNQGTALARKSGMEHATGLYIHQLDGDDFLELDCYETLYAKACETDADIVIMKFWFDDPDAGVLIVSKSYPKNELTNIEFLIQILSTSRYYASWQYICRSSVYQKDVTFGGGNIGEDVYLTSQLGYCATKIVTVETPLYHYITRSSSIMNRKMSEKKANFIISYPQLVNDYMSNKPEYNNPEIQHGLLCQKAIAEVMVLSDGYFKGAHERCRYIIDQQDPRVLNTEIIRPYRKLIRTFAISQILGRIYAQYYIMKGKIRK